MNPLSLQNIHTLLAVKPVVRNSVSGTLLLLFACLFANAQNKADKRLQLADQYFAAGEYFTAAGLYEQFLNPTVKEKEPTGFPLNSKKNSRGQTGKQISRLDILYKQAESYRLANYWPQASERYKECFEKDSVKYAAGLYWYAACQRSMGSYTQAEQSVNDYINSYSTEESYQQAAKQELATLQYIKGQIARPDSVLYQIQKINTSFATEKGIFSPAAISGNRYLITSTQADSVTKTGVNPFHNRLFYASLVQGNMQDLQPVMIEGMDATINQATATMSANGSHLYFTQWKKEKGQTVSAIYLSAKTENGWSSPVLVSTINLEGYNSKQPFCTADGKYIFFASDRPGGQGQFDIWYAALQPDGTAAEPMNAGAINSAGNEQAPFYHSNSSFLVFSSDRKPGMGGYDLFMSKGTTTEWAAPENMGHPVNSSRDDLYFFASQKEGLLNNAIITSDRGSECCLETYVVNKAPKQKIITGMIRDCRNNEPLGDAEVIMKSSDGRDWRMTTGKEGTYQFEWIGDITQQLFVSKDLYKDGEAGLAIEKTDESGWLIDVYTNADICLDKKLVIKPETVVTLYFDFDKSDLKTAAIEKLDSIYNVLIESPNATIQISGFTDGRGTVEYNKVLSDKRAKACADYLIERGVDTSRISFESFGACCPVEMEMINGRDNADGRSKNRRALINITKD